jgi:hypothetical protein
MPVATTTSQTGTTAGAAIKGVVHGGQSPIVGAHVYLYAVNNTGYAGPGIAASTTNQSVSLLNSNVMNQTPPGGQDGSGNWYATTDSNGNFTISGDYTCPAATPDTYLLATGGSPGGTGSSDSAIVLYAGVTDRCTDAGYSSIYAVVNEVSTVAAAYAGAGFATDPYHVSTSSTALAARAVDDAYGGLVNLETLGTGVAVSTTYGGNGIAPQAEINTLANILAACVNSTGSSSTQCTTLFDDAPNGATMPTDTGTAILNIAHNPGANISGPTGLYSLSTANPPFGPALTSIPNDFTVAISYTGGGLNGPYAVAVDASDDILVTNYGTNPGSISAFNPLGVPVSSTAVSGNGIAAANGIAIDGNGYIWVASTEPDALSSFDSTGTAVANVTTDLNAVRGIAVDGSNNVWVTNSGNNSVTEFSNSSGTPSTVTGDPFGTSVLDDPFGVAIDIHGNAWVTNRAGTWDLVKFSSSGSASSPYTGGGLGQPVFISFDPSGNAWVTDIYNTNDPNDAALSVFNSSGSAVTGVDGYYGSGLYGPWGTAIDSNGNVFVADLDDNISEFNSFGTAVSPASGYLSSSLKSPYFLAIDGSGNLWVPNYGNGAGNSITEFVGIAAPVVTPIAANLQSPYATNDSAVNRP